MKKNFRQDSASNYRPNDTVGINRKFSRHLGELGQYRSYRNHSFRYFLAEFSGKYFVFKYVIFKCLTIVQHSIRVFTRRSSIRLETARFWAILAKIFTNRKPNERKQRDQGSTFTNPKILNSSTINYHNPHRSFFYESSEISTKENPRKS